MKRFKFQPYLLVIWALVITISSAMAIEITEVLFISIIGAPIILCLCFFWPTKCSIRHKLLSNAVVIPFAFALVSSVVITKWPLKLIYVLARPTMNSIAKKIENGQHAEVPVQVGLFRIK